MAWWAIAPSLLEAVGEGARGVRKRRGRVAIGPVPGGRVRRWCGVVVARSLHLSLGVRVKCTGALERMSVIRVWLSGEPVIALSRWSRAWEMFRKGPTVNLVVASWKHLQLEISRN